MVRGCDAAKDHATKGDKAADHDQKQKTDKRYISDKAGAILLR